MSNISQIIGLSFALQAYTSLKHHGVALVEILKAVICHVFSQQSLDASIKKKNINDEALLYYLAQSDSSPFSTQERQLIIDNNLTPQYKKKLIHKMRTNISSLLFDSAEDISMYPTQTVADNIGSPKIKYRHILLDAGIKTAKQVFKNSKELFYVLDDTFLRRGETATNVSKILNHSTYKYEYGFSVVVVALTDGNIAIPLALALVSTNDTKEKANILTKYKNLIKSKLASDEQKENIALACHKKQRLLPTCLAMYRTK